LDEKSFYDSSSLYTRLKDQGTKEMEMDEKLTLNANFVNP
jgi:hypothetical protein